MAFTANGTGGSPITSYLALCVHTTNGTYKTMSGTASPLQVTGLTSGESYRCRVRATNAVGNGPYGPYGATVLAP